MKNFLFFTIIILFSATLLLKEAAAGETLSWEDCVREAAKNHPDLIAAEEAVKQSEAAKKITASALYPQISTNAGASTAKTSTTTSGNTTSKTDDSYTYGATATQLLFDGFKTTDKVKASSENIKAAQYNYRFTSSAVRLRLRNAFISMLKSQELLAITQEIYNIRRANLELITLRYESGIEHKGALLTAEANLSEAEFEIKQAERGLEVAERQLVKETGREKFSALKVKGGFAVKDAATEKPDFEALAKNNPSLGKLIAEKNAASLGIKAAKADFLPALSAEAGANRTSPHWLPTDDQWNAGLKVTLPIFEGGLRLAEIGQARALFNQARENERSARDGVISTLEQNWAALQNAVDTVRVQEKFLRAAEERAKIAEAQYSLGLIQFDNWTIIEDDLVSAKKNFLDAEANALLAEANWANAKGEVLEYAG